MALIVDTETEHVAVLQPDSVALRDGARSPSFDEWMRTFGFDLRAAGLGRPIRIESGPDGGVTVRQALPAE